MLGNALLCGKDKRLLDTRIRLLESVQIESSFVLSVGELEQIPAAVDFGLVVFGQLLTMKELEQAVPTVRRRWPDPKVLIFHFSDEPPQNTFADCEYLIALVPPQIFITKAKDLLEKR
jgi:hypothetical protein